MATKCQLLYTHTSFVTLDTFTMAPALQKKTKKTSTMKKPSNKKVQKIVEKLVEKKKKGTHFFNTFDFV